MIFQQPLFFPVQTTPRPDYTDKLYDLYKRTFELKCDRWLHLAWIADLFEREAEVTDPLNYYGHGTFDDRYEWECYAGDHGED